MQFAIKVSGKVKVSARQTDTIPPTLPLFKVTYKQVNLIPEQLHLVDKITY